MPSQPLSPLQTRGASRGPWCQAGGRQSQDPGQSSSSEPRLARREGQGRRSSDQLGPLCPRLPGPHQMAASLADGHAETRHSGVSATTWALQGWRGLSGAWVLSCSLPHLGQGCLSHWTDDKVEAQRLAKVTPGGQRQSQEWALI